MKTCAQVHFVLYGNFVPEDITAFIGVSPSLTFRKGTPVSPRASITHKEDVWRISSPEVETLDVSSMIVDLLNRVAEYSDVIVNACKYYSLTSQLEVVIYIEDDGMPAIRIKNRELRVLSSLETEIVFDIY